MISSCSWICFCEHNWAKPSWIRHTKWVHLLCTVQDGLHCAVGLACRLSKGKTYCWGTKDSLDSLWHWTDAGLHLHHFEPGSRQYWAGLQNCDCCRWVHATKYWGQLEVKSRNSDPHFTRATLYLSSFFFFLMVCNEYSVCITTPVRDISCFKNLWWLEIIKKMIINEKHCHLVGRWRTALPISKHPY